jgi:flagellar hook-associated protein 1 FlgK
VGTLTSLLDLSTAGLQADQLALNVTADNVANQNTPGYTRQVVTFKDGDYVTLGDGVLRSSSGPRASASSARDLELERAVQAEQQAESSSSTLGTIYTQIQTLFGVSGSGSAAGSTEIGTALDGLFSSLTALTGAPSDAATRQGVLSAANTLASSLNSASTQLTEIGTSLGEQAVSTVGQINALTATIGTLNDQIAAESPTSDAGTLEDQRQTAIEQLSQYVGLSQSTSQNNQINLTTVNGALLVVGGNGYKLSASNAGGTTAIRNSDGTNITAGLTGGSLGGLLHAAEVDVPQVSTALDTLAYSLGSQINQQNEAGLDGNGNAGQAIFTLPASSTGAANVIAVIPTAASAVAAAATGEGTSGNGNATALANLAQAANTSGETLDAFYASLISQIGTTAAAITEQNTAQQANLTKLTTQRDSESAVDLNEEAANLTTYQRAYQASAQVFTIADSIFADAINLGVESAVS